MPVMTWMCPVEGCDKVIRVEKRTRRGLKMSLSGLATLHRRWHERQWDKARAEGKTVSYVVRGDKGGFSE